MFVVEYREIELADQTSPWEPYQHLQPIRSAAVADHIARALAEVYPIHEFRVSSVPE